MRALLGLVRDVLSYVGGWLLMDSQAGVFTTPPSHPNETVMWIAALLIGVPGVAQVIALRFGGTAPVGSPPASGGSPASPSSPPSVQPAGEA